MEKVAVLMSYYDGDSYIEEQIESILNQEVDPNVQLDLFVRDDGSPTSDLAILKKYHHEKKINLIKGANLGVKMSFFKLLRDIKDYDFYFFSDQDDVWVKDKVQVMLNEFKKYDNDDPVGIYSDLFVADKDAKPTGRLMKKGILPVTSSDPRSSSKYILRYYEVTGASFAINETCRKMAVAMGEKVFEKTLMHDATIAFMLTSVGKLVYMDIPLVYYRQHGNNLIGAKEQTSLLENIRNIKAIIEGKVKKIYELYIVNENCKALINPERALLIRKIMTHRSCKSPMYMWKLREDVYGKHKLISQLFFLIFGISAVRKYQNKIY